MTVLQGNCLDIMKTLEDNSVDAIVTDPPYGLSFMGKKWDYDVPSTEIWQEALRVLKPGGYLLAFAGTRTQHRMAVRIEDAGFEIRDMIAWIYGSGFPKSLNIGKAVDKIQGNERELVDNPNTRDRTKHDATTIFTSQEVTGWDATKGTSQWEGWGTALKPALEPITVARKPLGEKTVAQNVLKWGVGGINIDGCRVSHDEPTKTANRQQRSAGWNPDNCGFDSTNNTVASAAPEGRFPANLIHDGSDEVVGLFPNSKGNGATGGGDGGIWTKGNKQQVSPGYVDSGSAARFFYCAKASKSERNRGCEELGQKIVNDGRQTDIDNAFQRGTTLRSNTHPTVKPIALMEYLVKLVSPENSIVLDPFAGSGSTLIACKNLGRQYIGIEMNPEYIEIINARLSAVEDKLF